MAMRTLETARLRIRPFAMEDLDAIHRILVEAFGSEEVQALDERARWLQWTMMGYVELAQLDQPPYGDRAIVLKSSGELIGACGYVPCLAPFEQLPGFAADGTVGPDRPFTPEVGLFYALALAHRRLGYGAEAAGALIDHAFGELRLKRIVATTTYDNAASIGVMRKLGMRIARNPYPDPPWLQVVGVREQ